MLYIRKKNKGVYVMLGKKRCLVCINVAALNDALIARGFSVTALAKKIGLSRQYLYRCIDGGYSVPKKFQRKILYHLRLKTFDDLFFLRIVERSRGKNRGYKNLHCKKDF